MAGTFMRRVISGNVIFALGFLIACGTASAQGTGAVDCGSYQNYADQNGTGCRRVGVIPWIAAQPQAWESELRLSSGGANLTWDFDFEPDSWQCCLNLLVNAPRLPMPPDGSGISGVSGLRIAGRASFTAQIVAGCGVHTCSPLEPVSGEIFVGADGLTASSLKSISAYALLKSFAEDGTVLSQTSIPAIFDDQATSHWRAVIAETVPRGGLVGVQTSFSVANRSSAPQAVIVSLLNSSGLLMKSGKTPVLPPGGVYADSLSNVAGFSITNFQADFTGTVTLEGEDGGKIAPVVFRVNGTSFAAVQATAN